MSLEGTAKRLLLSCGCTLDVYKDTDVDKIEEELKSHFKQEIVPDIVDNELYIEDFQTGELFTLSDLAEAISEVSIVASSLFHPVYQCIGRVIDLLGQDRIIYEGEVTDIPFVAIDEAINAYKQAADAHKNSSIDDWNIMVSTVAYVVIFGERDEEEREVFWNMTQEDEEKLGWRKKYNDNRD